MFFTRTGIASLQPQSEKTDKNSFFVRFGTPDCRLFFSSRFPKAYIRSEQMFIVGRLFRRMIRDGAYSLCARKANAGSCRGSNATYQWDRLALTNSLRPHRLACILWKGASISGKGAALCTPRNR